MQGSKGLVKFWLLTVPVTVLFYVALWLTIVFRYQDTLGHATIAELVRTFSFIFLLWLVVFFIHGLFEIGIFRRYTSLVFGLISAMAVNTLIAVIYFYFQPNLILTPRRFLLTDVVITLCLTFFWYLLMKYFFKSKLVQGVYIFSFGNELEELEREIAAHSYLGYKVLGKISETSLASAKIEKNSIIILPDNLNSTPQISEQLYKLRTQGVMFYNHKDFYENLLRRIYLSDLNELWFLENIDYQEKRLYNMGKRFVDVILGLIGIFFFLVSYPFCALAIKLNGKGPVLFVQERTGKRGKLFKVYKYRTMDRSDYKDGTSVQDQRITKVGKFLRKSRIDEWPQFINLILGHISLVGPRPERPHIVEVLQSQIPFYDERHLVKPGITGWGQVNNIYATTTEESRAKLQYDLYYVKHRGFLFDLEIILKTVYYIFTWQGR